MELSKQSQTGGDYSNQVQANTVVYNNYYSGTSEERTREIFRSEYDILAKELFEEAKKTAEERAKHLEDLVVPKMIEIDNTLKFLSDPSFQRTVRQAQLSAICSGKQSDFELLTELLLNRIDNGEDRVRKLAINRAIEVVDQIPEQSLIGIALVYAYTLLDSGEDDFESQLKKDTKIIEQILGTFDWPSGNQWIDCLDMLSLIRVNPKGQNFKSFLTLIPKLFQNFLVCGLQFDDKHLNELKGAFKKAGLPIESFKKHPLKPGFEFIDVPHPIEHLYLTTNIEGRPIQIKLTQSQLEVLKNALEITNQDASNDPQLRRSLTDLWMSYPILKQYAEWWSSIQYSFVFTPAGIALANAYVQNKCGTSLQLT